MSRPYAPRAVLRHLPLPLVRDFFAANKLPLPAAWGDLPDDDPDAVYAAWQGLPPDAREAVEGMLRAVHDLSDPAAARMLVEEAAFQGFDLSGRDPGLGHHAAALWVLVHAPLAFHAVARFRQADCFPGRYWFRVAGLPPAAPDGSEGTRMALQHALADYFRAEQGRGHRVTVEHHVRPGSGGGHYYFCYPDDYTQTHVGHDPRGVLRRTAVRPAFDVVFVADGPAGTVDLFAPGPKAVRAILADIFCKTVLNTLPPPEQPRRPVYQIDRLLDPANLVPPDPADGVREVRVRRLRVALPNTHRRVTVEGDDEGPAADVYALLDEVLPPDRHPRDRLHVSQATVTLSYRPADGGRDRTLTFDVTHPDGCSLKGKPDDQRALGERCLRVWGVAGGD